jgi:hypothetical protein
MVSLGSAQVAVGVAGLVVTMAAAARSTWSPCGLSMLSTITPLGERGRGQRYRSVAVWFVAGGTLGGLTLGAAMAGGAALVHLLAPSAAVTLALAVLAAGLGAVSDSAPGGRALPIHRRQVNELWLDQFRPWVYGAGFGWQIGTGLATYITTAAVYLLVVLGALSTTPWAAFGLGVLFGLARGLAVLLGRRIEAPAQLLDFHRRFDALGPRVRRAVIAVQAVVAAGLAAVLWPPLGAAAVVIVAVAGLRWRRRARAGAPDGVATETAAPASAL